MIFIFLYTFRTLLRNNFFTLRLTKREQNQEIPANFYFINYDLRLFS